MKKQYTQPELELRRLALLESVANSMSGDDNELDIGDTGWGDF